MMRTTLDIEDDLLIAAKEMARREHTSAGRIVSRLMRQALTQSEASGSKVRKGEPEAFYGFRPFDSRGGVVTNELVDRIREKEGI
jgi:hypothetical protein